MWEKCSDKNTSQKEMQRMFYEQKLNRTLNNCDSSSWKINNTKINIDNWNIKSTDIKHFPKEQVIVFKG